MIADLEFKTAEWPTKTLGDLLVFLTSGSRGWAEHYADSGSLFLRIQNVGHNKLQLNDVAFVVAPNTAEAQRTLVQPGDVLLSITADLGRTAVVPDKLGNAYINQHLAILRVKDIYPVFLSAFLSSPEGQKQILGRNRQGVKAGLNFDDVRSFRIPLPPIAEQKRITAILDAAEALREKRRLTIAKLDVLLTSIFFDMFGDPIENPKSWNRPRVSEFVREFVAGKNVMPADSGEITNNRILKVSAVSSLEFDPLESKPLPDTFTPLSIYYVQAGDLLISRANTTELVGATAYVWKTPDNVVLPDKIWRFSWREPFRADPLFVWYVFRDRSFRRELGKLSTGTSGSMKNISQEKVLAMQVILPPLELQRQFGEIVRRVSQEKVLQCTSLARLDDLFTSLQQRAFRGEL